LKRKEKYAAALCAIADGGPGDLLCPVLKGGLKKKILENPTPSFKFFFLNFFFYIQQRKLGFTRKRDPLDNPFDQ